MTSATRKRKSIEIPVIHIVAIIVLIVSVFLIVDFGRRAAAGYRIHKEEARLKARLQALQNTHANLETRHRYVQTEDYIEDIARNELKWSKAGEAVIVILATPQAPSEASEAFAVTAINPPVDTPFNAWMDLFFPPTEENITPADLSGTLIP